MDPIEQMSLQQIIAAKRETEAIDWLEHRAAGAAAPSVALDFSPTLSLQRLWESGHEITIINYLDSGMPTPSTPGAHSVAVYATPDAKNAQDLLNVAINKDANNTAAAALRQNTRRSILYNGTGLKKDLFETQNGVKRCVSRNIASSTRAKREWDIDPTEPSSRTFAANFSRMVKWNRIHEPTVAVSEATGRAVDEQCNHTIGEAVWKTRIDVPNTMGAIGLERTQGNFAEWDCHYCWLCNLPLWVGGQPPQCEHKLPILEMIIFGAGLATNIDAQANMLASQTKYGSYNRIALSQEWKNMVRGEAYGWSHTWCNMYKNQLPFLIMRSFEDTDTSTVKNFMHMEINTIYSYVEQSYINTFEDLRQHKNSPAAAKKLAVTQGNANIKILTKIMRAAFNDRYIGLNLPVDYFDNVEVDVNMGFIDTNPSPMIYTRSSRKNDICIFSDASVKQFLDIYDFDALTTEQKVNAYLPLLQRSFEGIIQMLTPTHLYLSGGSDIPQAIIKERNAILSGRGVFINPRDADGGSGIDQYTTMERARDNFERYAIMVNIPRQGETSGNLPKDDIRNFTRFLRQEHLEEGELPTGEEIEALDNTLAISMAEVFKTTMGKTVAGKSVPTTSHAVLSSAHNEEIDTTVKNLAVRHPGADALMRLSQILEEGEEEEDSLNGSYPEILENTPPFDDTQSQINNEALSRGNSLAPSTDLESPMGSSEVDVNSTAAGAAAEAQANSRRATRNIASQFTPPRRGSLSTVQESRESQDSIEGVPSAQNVMTAAQIARREEEETDNESIDSVYLNTSQQTQGGGKKKKKKKKKKRKTKKRRKKRKRTKRRIRKKKTKKRRKRRKITKRKGRKKR